MSETRTSSRLTAAAAEFIENVLHMRPRVAVFDCDGTLWDGDSGEQFLYWELDRGLLPASVVRWIRPRYRDYKDGKVSEEVMCAEMVTIHQGLSSAELQRAADEFFSEKFTASIFPDMSELVTRLHRSGCQVWGVSSTNEWVVRAGTRQFGIPDERVLAACVYCDDGIATGRLRRVPTDESKVTAMRAALDRTVDTAFGNSIHDGALLAMARHAFAINPNPDLQQMARQRGWSVYFPMGTAAHQG